MIASEKLIDYIEQAEGLLLKAKWDVNGWAIGYGHHGPEIYKGLVWTTLQAETALEADVQKVGEQVLALVKVPLSQGQYDALVDFTYNVGAGRLKESTLLALLNRKQYAAAAAQLPLWDEMEGKHNADLHARRLWELEQWNS